MNLPRLALPAVVCLLTISALLFTTDRPKAQITDINETGSTARFIIQLRDDVHSSQTRSEFAAETAAELGERSGGTVEKVYSSSIAGFVVETTDAAAADLAADPRVKAVQKDVPIYAAATQTSATWGLDRLDQRHLPLKGNYNYDGTGAGVDVYVIDSGIRGTHSEFSGRVVYDFDAIGDGQNGNDCYGHGTHVAGTIAGTNYGVAKEATLHSMRVLNCTGGGSVVGLLDAVEWITANVRAPAVVNISITTNAAITVIDDAINRSVASGITYVVAAANHGADACGFTPGRAASAITVASSSQSDARPSFSNYGPCVDIFAPGTGIYSAGIADDGSVAVKSGTSMSSPHAAGAAALLLGSDPLLTPGAIEDALYSASTSGLLTNAGAGSPDRLLYIGFNDSIAGTISSVSPNSGIAYIGSSLPITWSNRGDYNSRITIELSTDGGSSFGRTIAADIANSGVFSWSVPYLPTNNARIRVREAGETAPSSESTAPFAISFAPTAGSVSVSGRVADTDGRGIGGAIVVLTDPEGNTVSARTNTFGYFALTVRAGSSHILSINHRRYIFAPRHIEVNDDIEGLEIRPED